MLEVLPLPLSHLLVRMLICSHVMLCKDRMIARRKVKVNDEDDHVGDLEVDIM